MDKIIDTELLRRLEAEAAASPRLRMNWNVHEGLEEACQRLVNMLMPGTVIPVHRHPHTAETYVVLRGRLDVVLYGDDGGVRERVRLDPAEGRYGVNIPAGQWHTVEVLAPTAIFEVKEGPYRPLDPEDIMY